jgi:transcriptional regulator GlxA family with amidase domain
MKWTGACRAPPWIALDVLFPAPRFKMNSGDKVLAKLAQRPARQKASRNHVSDSSISRSPLRVLIVAVPPMRTLDVFGPAEVFGDANWLRGGDPAYQVNIISACADRVVANHLGTPVHTDRTYLEYSGPVDTLLVAGCMGPRELHYETGFLEWLRLQSTRARRFGSICTGAFVLAKAGLLDGRRATTHWNWATELAQDYPQVTVDPDAIYVRDGNCYTSAGVTAGIDLCLALVEQDLGRPLALRIAQMMVVFLRRPGGQSQFSATLEAQIGENHQLGDLLAWLPDHLRQDLSVDSLARRLAMSARNFARLFRQEIGKTPGEHIEELRLEAARRQLESTSRSTDEVAAACGLASAEVLRRLFRRRLQVTPGQYRTSFGQTGVR